MIKKKEFSKVLVLALCLLLLASCLTGCGYNKTVFYTIEPSQTAFVIDLFGDNTEQSIFASEEMLLKSMVSTKEVPVDHKWIKTGYMPWSGYWKERYKVIVVERKPVTREWNSGNNSGTSNKDQSIYAESKESIGFAVGMNCSCQIYTEDDAAKFLYSYNQETLETIMDTEIRARVESNFVEACAKLTMNEILEKKEEIMKSVRDDVCSYFLEKGITITVLGMKDGIDYDDKKIQESINEKFSSEQKLVTQENENNVIISKATAEAEAEKVKALADAEVKKIDAKATAESIKTISDALTKNYIEYRKIERWKGNLPTVTGADSTIIDMGSSVIQQDK